MLRTPGMRGGYWSVRVRRRDVVRKQSQLTVLMGRAMLGPLWRSLKMRRRGRHSWVGTGT